MRVNRLAGFISFFFVVFPYSWSISSSSSSSSRLFSNWIVDRWSLMVVLRRGRRIFPAYTLMGRRVKLDPQQKYYSGGGWRMIFSLFITHILQENNIHTMCLVWNYQEMAGTRMIYFKCYRWLEFFSLAQDRKFFFFFFFCNFFSITTALTYPTSNCFATHDRNSHRNSSYNSHCNSNQS